MDAGGKIKCITKELYIRSLFQIYNHFTPIFYHSQFCKVEGPGSACITWWGQLSSVSHSDWSTPFYQVLCISVQCNTVISNQQSKVFLPHLKFNCSNLFLSACKKSEFHAKGGSACNSISKNIGYSLRMKFVGESDENRKWQRILDKGGPGYISILKKCFVVSAMFLPNWFTSFHMYEPLQE